MPSKPVDTALRDILYHLELAANFSAGLDRASFKHDIKTLYAVTRCLEMSNGRVTCEGEWVWLLIRLKTIRGPVFLSLDLAAVAAEAYAHALRPKYPTLPMP